MVFVGRRRRLGSERRHVRNGLRLGQPATLRACQLQEDLWRLVLLGGHPGGVHGMNEHSDEQGRDCQGEWSQSGAPSEMPPAYR